MPGWRHPSARWVREAERLAALEVKLPAYLDGKPVVGAKLTLSDQPDFTDGDGRYRFDRVRPGDYDLLLWAEDAGPVCQPGQPCIGSALAVERRPITVRAGESHTDEWVYPYDDPPMYSDQGPSAPTTTTR